MKNLRNIYLITFPHAFAAAQFVITFKETYNMNSFKLTLHTSVFCTIELKQIYSTNDAGIKRLAPTAKIIIKQYTGKRMKYFTIQEMP
jgi:hypothetical protein